MSEQKPSVGRAVHYVAYGTPGGEFPAGVCRAAVITEVGPMEYPGEDPSADNVPHQTASLCVMNPTGLFFNRNVPYHDGSETPGDPTCPMKAQHGNPFRFCPCGWQEARHRPGTWHWPERT